MCLLYLKKEDHDIHTERQTERRLDRLDLLFMLHIPRQYCMKINPLYDAFLSLYLLSFHTENRTDDGSPTQSFP
jgi:hypothetical protein